MRTVTFMKQKLPVVTRGDERRSHAKLGLLLMPWSQGPGLPLTALAAKRLKVLSV